MALQCTVQYKHRQMVYGRTDSTGHASRAEACQPITVQYLSVGLFDPLPLTDSNWDPHVYHRSMFLNISAVSGLIFLKSTLFPLVK